jgi:hypothetical protein
MSQQETSLVTTEKTEEKTIDAYQSVFIPARETMLNKLDELKNSLSEKEAQLISKLIKSANPQKKGREEMDNQWVIPTIRVIQSVTKEKPEGAEPGNLCTTTGSILTPPFKFTPLYIYRSNRMFAEGSAGNAPVCVAPDAKVGRPLKECARCPHYPLGLNATGTVTQCDNGLCFIVLSQDMKLYRIDFFKTSRKAGTKLDQLASDSDSIWDKWFSLKSQIQMSQGGREWFIFKVVATNDETPQHVRDAADIIYDLIHVQRKLYLEQHYRALTQDGDALDAVNENVTVDTFSDNADLSTADISNSGL